MAAAMGTTRLSANGKIALNYDSFTKKCENYVSANEETAQNIKCFLKSLYGVVKETETSEGLPSGEALPELIVDNFDEEQIWQELELQNETRVDSLVGKVARLVAQKDKFKIDTGPKSGKVNGVVKESSSSDDESELDGEEASEEEEDYNDDDEEEEEAELGELNFGNDDNSDENEDEEEEFDEEESDEDPAIPEIVQDDDDISSEDDDEDQPKKKSKGVPQKKKPIKPSLVDDKFFKLSEMEDFLEREEQDKVSDDEDSDEESIDLFNEIPSDESDEEEEENDSETENKGVRYSDFFDAPDQETQVEEKISHSTETKGDKKKKVKFDFGGTEKEENEDISDETSDSETSELQVPSKIGEKSSYEIRQEKLKAKIKQLEEEALSEKPWQLRGEVSGECRPENALLEEALEFDLTHRPAPVITEETTQRLEDIIKQRIKDKAWDDVEKKEKPVEAPSEFKKKLVLDQEKSKISLAQVYEQEYLKQVAAADPEQSEKPEEIPKEHIEIKAMVNDLFRKLDALSNFHFTPKQVAPEVKIVTNIPAINIEEVAPVATSNATLLAPEEIKAKPKGDVKSQAEKTETDKNRDRRLKKKHQRLVAREREKKEAAVEKLKPGLGNKYSKEKAIKMLEKVSKDSNVSLIDSRAGNTVKSSTAFFSQLQDEVTSQIKGKTQIAKKRKIDSKSLSVKRLKM